MVTLFLVEDEIAMRESIRRNIRWEDLGITFCGEAGDGELAWPLIQDLRPDIVLTDIKMPFMDGLELSALIRRELPDTKIVILSGYTEFEYAQSAIRLGVTEYLVKPITPRQLKEVTGRLAAQIEAEKKVRLEQVDNLAEEQREKEEHERRGFFKTLITGGMSSHDILQKAEEINVKLGAPFYRLALTYVIPGADGKNQETADEILLQIGLGIEDCICFTHSMDSRAILLTGRSQEEPAQKALALQAQLDTLTQEAEGLNYFISAGRTVSHLSQVSEAYHEAYRAAAARFFLSPNQMIEADTVLPRILAKDTSSPINTQQVLQNGNLRTIWESFLRTGTLSEAGNFVADAFSSVGEENVQSTLFLHYLTMDCCFCMMRFLKDLGIEAEEAENTVGDLNTIIDSLHNAQDARSYLTSCLEKVMRLRDGRATKKNSQLLQNALAYIEENYTDGNLSLQDVAAATGLSPNRFSTLFSHEMGETFMEYLIGKRIDRACSLLMTTDMKSFEIAYSSGYNDPHYFSATFKKLKGMSPMEYRKRG